MPSITLLVSITRRMKYYPRSRFAKWSTANIFQKSLSPGIITRFSRSCQDKHRDVDRLMGGWVGVVVMGGGVEEAGFLNGKMLLNLEQGTKVGREATCRFKGKPDGEKFPPNYPTPNPRTPKQTLKGLAVAAAQPHCAEQFRKWREEEEEGRGKEGKWEGGKSKTKEIKPQTEQYK